MGGRSANHIGKKMWKSKLKVKALNKHKMGGNKGKKSACGVTHKSQNGGKYYF
jgi:hypothetical protein